MRNIKEKMFRYLLPVLFTVCFLSGCGKVSHNGKLDGQWQIMKIENLETAEENVPDKRVYICLNLHVVQLTSVGLGGTAGNMQYDKKSGIINWDFPYNMDGTQLKFLENWGIYSNPVIVEVLKVDGSALVLKTPETVITCRRF